jgi:hypothetical protein
LHKPIFIVVDCEEYSEVSAIAEKLLDHLITDGSHDWYQGIIESGRWSKEWNWFDTPRLWDERIQIKDLIKHFLKSQKKEILDWIKRGNEELKDKTKEFSWALTNLSIGSGDTPIHLFDSTSWSAGSGILDRQTIKGIKKHTGYKLWIKGYDIHY